MVTTIVFFLPRAMPGDPIAALQDPNSSLFVTDPDARQRLVASYGLDRPLWEQYVDYLRRLTQGDLGFSLERKAPVSSVIAAHLPWTMLLLGASLTMASVISFAGGVTAAWNRGRLRDRGLLVAATGARALPPYASAVLLLLGLAVLVPVFPLSGANTAFADYSSPFERVADVAHHLVLPATALTLAMVTAMFLLVRNTMVSALGQDYMVLARAKGLPDRLLKYRHAGRNALLPFVALLGVEVGFAVGPAIFVEVVFAYPGMGSLVLRAVAARDYPVLEAVFLVLAVMVLTANLAVDLVSAHLDPRTVTA
jgi:peptide/nickel transport system permease protein